MIMKNNLLFESLGIPQMAFNLNISTNAKSKGVAREDSNPLYEPTGDDEDLEDGVVHKVSETSSAIRPTGGTRGSKRVSA
ncbi:unnamed protein product [Urochloa humidicola]